MGLPLSCPLRSVVARARRQRLLAAGKCPGHPKRNTLDGYPYCRKCLLDKKRTGGQRQNKRRDVGLCVNDGLPCFAGRVVCASCYNKRHLERAIRKGVEAEYIHLATIFERDEYTCRHCKSQLEPDELVPDHIIPISLGGPHKPWNLQTLCISCNDVKKNNLRREPLLVGLLDQLIERFRNG